MLGTTGTERSFTLSHEATKDNNHDHPLLGVSSLSRSLLSDFSLALTLISLPHSHTHTPSLPHSLTRFTHSFACLLKCSDKSPLLIDVERVPISARYDLRVNRIFIRSRNSKSALICFLVQLRSCGEPAERFPSQWHLKVLSRFQVRLKISFLQAFRVSE